MGEPEFALLRGHADIAVPLVLAAQVAYLGLLGTHPRSQQYLAAQEADRKRQATKANVALRRILTTLPPRALQRYEALCVHCIDDEVPEFLQRRTATVKN